MHPDLVGALHFGRHLFVSSCFYGVNLPHSLFRHLFDLLILFRGQSTSCVLFRAILKVL